MRQTSSHLRRSRGRLRLLLAHGLLVAVLLAAGCGGGSGPRGEPQSPSPLDPGAPAMSLHALVPDSWPEGQPFTLEVRGAGFFPTAIVTLDGAPLPTVFIGSASLRVEVPALPRGEHRIAVRVDGASTPELPLHIGNAPPRLSVPSQWRVPEEVASSLSVAVEDADGDPVRIEAVGLPPGARWDEASRTLTFQPTFIQGGTRWPVTFVASDGHARSEATVEVEALDTRAPPFPTVVSTQVFTGYRVLTLRQVTDDFLDSPGYAGRAFEARVVVPDGATSSHPLSVAVILHGSGLLPQPSDPPYAEFRIYPADPDDTYWWGYGEHLPGAQPTSGLVPGYTARRVLHLLEWLLKQYPGADPERVSISGTSMGGAGAATIGLLYARHFAVVSAQEGAMVPRFHRTARLGFLAPLWGDPDLNVDAGAGVGVWDWLDVTRILRDVPEARDQYLVTKHGKDDATIQFGSMVRASPLTGRSFFETLRTERIGHLSIWDESGHDLADPVLGKRWWGGWDTLDDPLTFLRRDRPFPAFTACSNDRNPGDGSGNGRRLWDVDEGFAGNDAVAGDTGWAGELAGVLNRGLRWDATAVVDQWERLELPLFVHLGDGSPAPRAGYPTLGHQLDGSLPVSVDVTPRRVQHFRLLPGERVAWSFGAQHGEGSANADGSVTVTGLRLTTAQQTLVLERR